MTFLSEIKVEKLGVVEDLGPLELSSGLNLIFGKNGSGKSTLRSSINYSFFGLPAKASKGNETRHKASYFNTSNKRRSISGKLNDGSRNYAFSISNEDGKKSKPAEFSDAKGAELLELMKDQVSESEFRSVFTITSDDMDFAGSQNPEVFVSQLEASIYGTDENPEKILAALSIDIKNHGSKDQRVSCSVSRDQRDLKLEQDQLNSHLLEIANAENSIVKKAQVDEELLKSEKTLALLDTFISQSQSKLQESQRILQEKQHVDSQRKESVEHAEEVAARISALAFDEARSVLAAKEHIQPLISEEALIVSKKEQAQKLKLELDTYADERSTLGKLPSFANEFDKESFIKQGLDLSRDMLRARESYSLSVQQIQLSAKNTFNPISYLFFALAALFAGLGIWSAFAVKSLLVLVFVILALGSAGLGTWLLFKVKNYNHPSINDSKTSFESAENALREYAGKDFPIKDVNDFDAFLQKIEKAFQLDQDVNKTRKALDILQDEIQDYQKRMESLTAYLDSNSVCLRGSLSQILEESELVVSQAQRLNDQLETVQRSIESDNKKLEDLEKAFENLELEEGLEELLEERKKERAKLFSAFSELSQESGRLGQVIESVSKDKEVEESKARLAVLESQREESARDLIVNEIAHTLLVASMSEYRDVETPDIIESASDIFNRISEGEFVHISSEPGSSSLQVVSKEGHTLAPYQLSTGTKEQLYLSLRLGMLLSFKDRGADLPVILDDAFMSFDDDRRKLALVEIVELAKHRQVLFLTNSEDISHELKEIAPDVKSHNLS